MARGFLGGLVIGGAISVVGAGILSVVAFPPSQAPIPPDVQPPEQTALQSSPQVDAPVMAPEPDAPSAAPQAPTQNPAPAYDATQPALPAPVQQPPMGEIAALTAPDAPQENAAPQVSSAVSTPEPSPQPDAPEAPPSSDAPTVQTTPSAPLPDAKTDPQTALAPSVTADAPTQIQATPNPDATPAPEALAAPRPVVAPQVTAQAAPTPDPQPQVAPDPAPQQTEAAPAPPRSTLPTLGDTADSALAGLPRIGRPATSLVARAGARNPARMPPQDAVSATGLERGDGANAPALARYAVPFDADTTRPLMSIVLMDQGQDLSTGVVGMAALSSFPYPLTFAVDVNLPDAQDRMVQYRALGFEVMALVDLPEALTGADTEVALNAALRAVPEAVAILEGPGTGLQGARALSDQVSSIAGETGHGVVWRPKGLDTAQKLAAREGVASQTLFRDFDNDGQTPTVIRRFLDQAAFKAGQQGAVIMVGRVRADTISALLVWGLQDRASRVVVAPISAVLTAQRP